MREYWDFTLFFFASLPILYRAYELSTLSAIVDTKHLLSPLWWLAILGVSRSSMQPVWDGEKFAPRLMLPVSFSYDHRVIDGAYAVRFTTFLCQQLADIDSLLEASSK